MRLANTTDRYLTLPNGARVPAGGAGAVPDAEWRRLRGTAVVSAWLAAGYLVDAAREVSSASPEPAAKPQRRRTAERAEAPAGPPAAESDD